MHGKRRKYLELHTSKTNRKHSVKIPTLSNSLCVDFSRPSAQAAAQSDQVSLSLSVKPVASSFIVAAKE